ncbi:MAG: hypothetical protein HY042_12835 [Spirochaetia bacterium]|nr:hypothetical protein [Spirochaetia bacterium]
MKIAGKMFVLIMILVAAAACGSDIKDQGDAYQEIYVAIAYKKSECGSMPSFPLLVPKDPPVYGTDACSMAIIAQPCPFTQYPPDCLAMYGAHVGGYGPAQGFIESTKRDLGIRK